ncbi:MAG: TraR/DksA family transcriptional regulator [Desulfobacteraceae bacterium]
MDDDLRSVLADSLLAKKEELQSVLRESRESWRENSSGRGLEDIADEADGAQCEISTHNYYSFVERKTRELRKIQELIQRVQWDEEFGICEECGDPIPVERLMIVPDATLCVPCQQEFEKSAGSRLSGSSSTAYSSEGGVREWEDPDLDEDSLVGAQLRSFTPLDPDLVSADGPVEEGSLDK